MNDTPTLTFRTTSLARVRIRLGEVEGYTWTGIGAEPDYPARLWILTRSARSWEIDQDDLKSVYNELLAWFQ